MCRSDDGTRSVPTTLGRDADLASALESICRRRILANPPRLVVPRRPLAPRRSWGRIVGVRRACHCRLGLTLLAWFLWEWAQFAYRYYFLLPRLTLHREVRDDRKAVPVLWAESEFEVRVRIGLGVPGDLPYVVLADWVPTDGRFVDGSDEAVVALAATRPATIQYRLKCPVPGGLRFEGVRIRIADRQGFFYCRTLIPDGSTYLVLPRLTGRRGRRRGVEEDQYLSRRPACIGFKRPGGGSELLDLRDYIPGDPPKMIAWKPSARTTSS